jgi:septum formation inhibitor-activating ATPase MinD
VHGSHVIPWKESDGKPLVPQSESGVQEMYQLVANRMTGDLFPKTLVIKTKAVLLKKITATTMKTEGATKIFPRNSIPNSMKSK